MLENEIQELINFPINDKSAWVTKFKNASSDAISGAILHWQASSGISSGPDQYSAKREAAHSILQSKLTEKITSTMLQLDKSANLVAIVGVVLAVISTVAGIYSAINT